MKVSGPSGSQAPIAGRSGARSAGEGFSLQAPSGGASAAPAAATAAAGAVASLEALLALQETDTPLERRRRAVRRAGRILDALDDLRVAVLDPDALDGAVMQRLQNAVREARGETNDTRLEGVLEEIEIRAAVEMAKREVRAAA